MSRRARVAVPCVPYHVTQRGNRKTHVFLDAEDRHIYLELLREYSRRHELRIWAYSLMTNHVHFVVLPHTESSLSATMRDTHSTYATRFNKKYSFVGHLWQSRFYSAPLDDSHLLAAVRYVERNAVRAGIVTRASDYPWSSAGPHALRFQDRYIDDGLPFLDEIRDWERWLAPVDSPEQLHTIRRATSLGLPCGSARFVRDLEVRSGRVLQRKRPGRPVGTRSSR